MLQIQAFSFHHAFKRTRMDFSLTYFFDGPLFCMQENARYIVQVRGPLLLLLPLWTTTLETIFPRLLRGCSFCPRLRCSFLWLRSSTRPVPRCFCERTGQSLARDGKFLMKTENSWLCAIGFQSSRLPLLPAVIYCLPPSPFFSVYPPPSCL